MPTPFKRTANGLSADQGRASAAFLAAGLLLLGAWLTWAVSAHITCYEVSESARLEVAGAASPLEAIVTGVVRTSHLNLGQIVTSGEILLELDDHDQVLALKQEQIRYSQLQPQLAALQNQIDSEDAGRHAEDRVLAFSKTGASELVHQAKVEAGLALQEQLRSEKLYDAGLTSQADLQKARAASESKATALSVLEQTELRLGPEMKVRAADRTAKQRQIMTDVTRLKADISSSHATIDRLRYEIEKRKLRAQVSGALTECAVLHPGTHISEGQQLGMILPAGNVQIVADFDPASAFGKVHAGQPATVRLNGFPWAQFGVINARVSRVAGELRNGKVHVELAPTRPANPRIPLQHGLPGTVEIATEQLSPAALLLRSAGRSLGAH